jgi:hypothetical protein
MFEKCLSIAEATRESSHIDQRTAAAVVLARGALQRDDPDEALALAEPVVTGHSTSAEFVEEAYAVCVEALQGRGDSDAGARVMAIVAALPPARATPVLRAGHARLAAVQARRAGDPSSATTHAAEAIALLRSVDARPLLARTLLEQAGHGVSADAVEEARQICRQLRAAKWLERAESIPGVVA